MFLTHLKSVWRRSAVRLTLSLLLVFFVVTTIAWAGTYFLVQREMNRLVDARLQLQLSRVQQAQNTAQPLPQFGFGFGQQISVTTSGKTVGTLAFPIPNQVNGIYNFDKTDDNQREFRYLIHNTADGRIIIAESTERQEELREILEGGILVSIFGTLIAGLLAGLWLARQAQHRLDIIRDALGQVAQGHLDTRISLEGRPDDLTDLAGRINTTTARLEMAMEQMRVQSSNIAHDLRTPLARLRAQIETNLLALSEDNQAVSVDDMGSALEQIDNLTGTFNALLRLSRVESGAGKSAFIQVDLAALAEQVSETFAPVVEDIGQSLVITAADPKVVLGDKDLLTQIMANLIQNAMRYGANGQTIGLNVKGTTVSVTDQGPGIPPAQRDQVLQPLYQMESTRQNDGFGLGLSMVRAIADLHEAELTLEDRPNGIGLVVSIEFPKITNL